VVVGVAGAAGPVDESGRDPASRRSFLGRAAGASLAGCSAVLLAACGDGATGPGAASTADSGERAPSGSAGSRGDVRVLNYALAAEHLAIAAYTAGIPLLGGTALRDARWLLQQEHEHAAALQHAIRKLHGTPAPPRRSYDLGTPKSQADVLKLLNRIERTVIGTYIGAVPKLRDPRLRATAAAIATTEAEHVTVLLRALGHSALPSAFVTGRA
jgi:rubrerythrin